MVPILITAGLMFGVGAAAGFLYRSNRLDGTLRQMQSEIDAMTELIALGRLQSREVPGPSARTLAWLDRIHDPLRSRPGRAAERRDH